MGHLTVTGFTVTGFPSAACSSVVDVEDQLEAAAGGRPEGLLGVVAEGVGNQPATGRCKLWRVHARQPRRQTKAWPRPRQGARTWEASRESGIR